MRNFDEPKEYEVERLANNSARYQLPALCADRRLLHYAESIRGDLFVNLDTPEVQAILCQRLRAVSSIAQATEWKNKYGSLWSYTNPEKTLKLAHAIRWIYKFYDLLKWEQTSLLRKYYCFESDLNRAAAKMTEREYYLNVAKMAAGESLPMADSMNTIQVALNMERPEKGNIIFSPDGVYKSPVYHLSTTFGALSDGMITEIFPHCLEQSVPNAKEAKADDETLLSLASTYFERLINQQVQCIQLAVRPVETEFGIRLQQTFAARYPWQAILSAMLKEVTGGSAPRKCANTACTEFFIAKKSHQIFCSRPGCRKAASRRKTSK